MEIHPDSLTFDGGSVESRIVWCHLGVADLILGPGVKLVVPPGSYVETRNLRFENRFPLESELRCKE